MGMWYLLIAVSLVLLAFELFVWLAKGELILLSAIMKMNVFNSVDPESAYKVHVILLILSALSALIVMLVGVSELTAVIVCAAVLCAIASLGIGVIIVNTAYRCREINHCRRGEAGG